MEGLLWTRPANDDDDLETPTSAIWNFVRKENPSEESIKLGNNDTKNKIITTGTTSLKTSKDR